MKIAGKNLSFLEIMLTEDTEFEDCSMVLARLTKNGHRFKTKNCNRAGLYVDGVKQDDYVWQRREFREVDGVAQMVVVEERS